MAIMARVPRTCIQSSAAEQDLKYKNLFVITEDTVRVVVVGGDGY